MRVQIKYCRCLMLKTSLRKMFWPSMVTASVLSTKSCRFTMLQAMLQRPSVVKSIGKECSCMLDRPRESPAIHSI